ncbi:hypothetical protein LAJ19_05990 [Deinococcus taeanensis]|uniref:hypothetical protein n=1 Tax=Deinococcus taeanensis TaxID=2737050 RepID=UPI001CDD700F|nr:hypothetical protein [Deinococcus taeanensis]UBV43763.1 hypothetical protein LAJ19_05990 [Deinococcus taeanensis]
MSRRLLLALTAVLTFSPALAQATTTVTLPGKITTQVKDVWAAFAAAGGKAELLSADGTVLGTLNADGTVTLTGTATLSDVKSVRLTPAQGDAVTVNVTRDLSKPGAVKIEYISPDGKKQSLPLPAIVNRLRATAPTTDDSAESATDDSQSTTVKPDKKSGKSGSNSGKGRP